VRWSGPEWRLVALPWIRALPTAHALLSETLARSWSSGSLGSITLVLETFAGLLAALGQDTAAIRLAEAANAMRENLPRGGFRSPFVAPVSRRHWLEVARQRLGDQRAAIEAAAGRLLSPAEAVSQALSLAPDEETVQAVNLTARELEVVTLVAGGHSNREIARELIIAVSTVERHVSNILGKLELRSRTELAAWAFEQGLLGKRKPSSVVRNDRPR
jgi:DNA-binding CsgD family transcriptional regulator